MRRSGCFLQVKRLAESPHGTEGLNASLLQTVLASSRGLTPGGGWLFSPYSAPSGVKQTTGFSLLEEPVD